MSAWPDFLAHKPVNAHTEMGAYECLWQQPDSSTKRLAALFRAHPGSLPSELVPEELAERTAGEVVRCLADHGIERFGLRVNGTLDYPTRLRDAVDPVELLYFLGSWELAEAPRRIAVVGTRQVTSDGAARTRKLVRELVAHDFTIVSGLAEGVDTIAHATAIEHDGRTFAVIGTPISKAYPKPNAELQQRLADDYLVISQVPILRYHAQTASVNRFFFPERNKTMSVLAEGTIIVEAGETSGTLTQARAALDQGRKLFILENNFQNPALTWPAKFEKLGAIRVRSVEDVLPHFSETPEANV